MKSATAAKGILASTTKKNPLREVFDIRREELPIVTLLFLFFFLVIAVFQILRPLKKGLFVEYYGADLELYAKLSNILVAAVGVAAFTYLYKKLPRQRLLYVFCGFFIVCFVALGFALIGAEPLPIWGFYVLGDLLSTLMVAAFFAFLTDVATPDQAKRLFGVIGGGGVVGGWAGSTLARTLLNTIRTQGLLFLSAALMGMIILVIFWTERLIRQSLAFKHYPGVKPIEKPQTERQSSFSIAVEGARLVLRSKYLAAIVGVMGFYEIASQVGDYQFSRAVEHLSGVAGTQQFMANVYFYANFLAVLVQFFLVSVIMKKAGVVAALLVLPCAILCSSLAFFAMPTLYMASLFVISENGLNYSIQQTARESLYVVTTPEEKYKARAFTNMFVQRLAKGLSILAVIGLGMLEVAVRYLSLVTLVVVMVMAICSIYAGRIFSQKSEALESGSRASYPQDQPR